MPKRYLTFDEWYPVYSLREEHYDWEHKKEDFAEFTDAELADLVRVGKEFAAWQVKMTERFGKEPSNNCYGEYLDEPLEEPPNGNET